MAGVKFPSSFDVTGRFPLDAKYWVDSFANLSDGEISVGLHRWTLDTGKEYVYQKNNTWKDVSNGDKGDAGTITVGTVSTGEIARIRNRGTSSNAVLDFTLPQGNPGSTPIIDIGNVTTGNIPSVQNVGTPDRAILNITLPQAVNGTDGSIGKSIWVAYADDINGTNAEYIATGKKYISFVQDFNRPAITAFNKWAQINGVDGKSVWIAYSSFSNGSNATYVLNTEHKYISIINSTVRPQINEFTVWTLFKGLDGGPAGASAYQSWLQLGNSGTQAQFIASLEGNKGASAYDIWLSLGNIGTEQDFINSLGSNTSFTLSTINKQILQAGENEIELNGVSEKIVNLFLYRKGFSETILPENYFIDGNRLVLPATLNLLQDDLIYGNSLSVDTGTRPSTGTATLRDFKQADIVTITNTANWDIMTGQYIGPALTTDYKAEYEQYATASETGYFFSTNGQGKVNRYLAQ